ncbi:MAG: hypothetical protein ACK4NS_03610 [Saprospiraceae bacterium]
MSTAVPSVCTPLPLRKPTGRGRLHNDGIWEPFAMPKTFPGLLPAQFRYPKPSFSGDRSARVACVVDTSYSVGTEVLATALGEIFAVLQAFRHTLRRDGL